MVQSQETHEKLQLNRLERNRLLALLRGDTVKIDNIFSIFAKENGRVNIAGLGVTASNSGVTVGDVTVKEG